MSATATAGLVAVGEDTPDEDLKGYIVFFSMPDDPVAADQLIAAALAHDIDERYLPDTRKPVHVFQSACASVAERIGTGNGRVEVRVDEVEDNPARCSYQITRVIWDLDNRIIEHEKAMRLEFNKRDQSVRSERLDHYDPALNDLEDAVRRHYEANMTTIPGAKVRNMVRDILIRMGGLNMRRRAGGVYFVPRAIPGVTALDGTPRLSKPILGDAEQGATRPNGLIGLLEELYGNRGDMYTINVMDGAGERKMIQRHAVLNIVQQARLVSQKAFQRLHAGGDRKVRDDFATNLANDRRQILQLLAHFQELVGMEVEDVQASLKELDEAIQRIEAAAA
jgi:hypothetical protein